MAKEVTLGGQKFTPSKELDKQQKEASKRVQKMVTNLKKAEASLVSIWLSSEGKTDNARQRKKIVKVVTPWEEAKEAGKTYESSFLYLNQGTRQNEEMFTLSVMQTEGVISLGFSAPKKETGFNDRAAAALQKIKF